MSKPHENQHDRIDCEQVRAWLAAAEELAPEVEARVREHLRDCSGCQAVATWISEVDRVAASVPAPSPPDAAYFTDLRQRVMDEISKDVSASRTPSRWQRWLRAPVLAPTAALIVLVGVLTVHEWRDEPVQVPLSEPLDRAQVAENRPEAEQEKRVVADLAAPEEAMRRITPPSDDSRRDSHDEIEEAGKGIAHAEAEAARHRAPEASPPASARPQLDDAVDEAMTSFAVGRDRAAEEDLDTGRTLVQTELGETSALEGAVETDAPARLEKAVGAEADTQAETAALKDDDVLRDLLLAAREHEGLSTEEAVLSRLLNQLESADAPSWAQGSKMNEEMRARETMALRQSASPQPVSASLEAETAPPTTISAATSVVDSAAVHLRARLPLVQDPELRQRIEDWLLVRENPEAKRE